MVIDAVLSTGVTQDFLLRHLEESAPRSLRLAVLFDKPESRRVNLQPEYTGFAAASKQWVGYGLGGRRGAGRKLPYVAVGAPGNGRARQGRAAISRKRQGTSRG